MTWTFISLRALFRLGGARALTNAAWTGAELEDDMVLRFDP